ncbi:MAG TPA: glycosyl hydrolase 53 family protein [Candidatus Blautia gallistercoris]|uniref:Arabinogalactan endo-beta-1,4-galactanase n=1 Tax=Candidatus Blautia gallistercoris TaxID=2838490 RepID=A0A9D1WI17_9FIRM|nr:glycosyl hydrolase 53 family protein [Candidatus Blautia gallistercoris]
MEKWIKGMDVSSLKELEELGAVYYDRGKPGDLLDILQAYGCNGIRLRLWNDPYSEEGVPYGAGTNDLAATIELAKRVRSRGMDFLLDFHYSDCWADPGKQRIPKAWRNLDAGELEQAVYGFTRETLLALREAQAFPTMVQVGNELTNGMLWPYGKVPEYEQLARFINAGIRGVRSVDEDIPIMLHLDNGGNNALYREWFDEFLKRGEAFQVIGLSYYPFWHGTLADLENNMQDLARRYGKEMIVAEVSTGHTLEDYQEYEKLPDERRKGMAANAALAARVPYPMTPEGQKAFMEDFMARIARIPGVRGFYYWEPAWIPVPGSGWASSEALEYMEEKGPGGNEWANQALFDYDGNVLPALAAIRDFRP